jgi:hypothetical protein
MTTPITRAADRHLTLAALHEAKPKPEKQKKTKRVPVEKQRKRLEKQLEGIVKLIIFWRDGQQCVQRNMDGGRCGNGLMWGHYIAQKQSHWLKYDLGNVFVQCGSHNYLDFHGDKSYGVWFISMFGVEAARAMEIERNAGRGKKHTIDQLEFILAHYDDLYQNRYTVNLDLRSLVAAGYYGSIIKGCFA